jgi:hypothetical protein
MMESLFGLSERYKALEELLDDETIPQEDVNRALMEVMDDVKSKGENGINYLHMLDGNIELAKKRKKEIDNYVKRVENRKKRILTAYLAAMNAMKMKSIMTGVGELKVKKNPPAVIIDDGAQVPAQYKKQTVTIAPDKTKIKAAINAGEKVPGAHLEQAVSLSY